MSISFISSLISSKSIPSAEKPLNAKPTAKNYGSTSLYENPYKDKKSSTLEKLNAVLGYCFLGCSTEETTSSEKNNSYNEKSPVQYTAQYMPVLKRQIIKTTSRLPDSIKKEMQECEDQIKRIIYNIELSPEEIFSAINEVLQPKDNDQQPKVNIGADISFEFNHEKVKENCRIAVAAILGKEDVQNLKLNIEGLQSSIYREDQLRLVDLLEIFFEKNKKLAHLDLSLRNNNLEADDLAQLGRILLGRKLYSLDLSGNITNTEFLNDGLIEICNYFGKMEISKLYLNDWVAMSDSAESGLELLAKYLPNAKNLRELSLRDLLIRINEVGILIPPNPTTSVLLDTSIETLDLRGHFLLSDVEVVEERVSKINEEIAKRNKEKNENRKPIEVILS